MKCSLYSEGMGLQGCDLMPQVTDLAPSIIHLLCKNKMFKTHQKKQSLSAILLHHVYSVHVCTFVRGLHTLVRGLHTLVRVHVLCEHRERPEEDLRCPPSPLRQSLFLSFWLAWPSASCQDLPATSPNIGVTLWLE